MKYRGLVLPLGLLLTAFPLGSAWAVNNTTNTISGVTTNGGTSFIFPSSGLSNVLFIINAGVLTNGGGQLGSAAGDSFNQIVVKDSGSVWSNTSTLYIGNNGIDNIVTVSDFGALFAPDINVANTGQGNQLFVTATGQVNSTTMIVGRFFGNGSVLTVTNGGLVNVATSLYVGDQNAAATNNLMNVTGPGSKVTAGSLRVGSTGSSNQMMISHGGVVVNGSGGIGPNGAFNNTVLVTDSGSVWSNTSTLTIGANNGYNNRLTVASSGTVYATTGITLGDNLNSFGNQLIVTNGGRVIASGNIFLANGGDGTSNNLLVVTGSGSLLINNGALYVGRVGPGNRMEIRQGGVVINTLGGIGNNGSAASNDTVLVTDSGSVWSNTSSLTIGANNGAKNTLTIAASGTVYASDVTLGANLNSYGNQLIVTNGGRYVGGAGIVLGVVNQPGTSNNLVKITGAGSLISNGGAIVIGNGSARNQLQIEDGGQAMTVGISRIGIQAVASNNTVTVTGVGTVWSNTSSIVVGSGSTRNSMVVSNGAKVYGYGVNVGENVGASNNSLVVTGPGSSMQSFTFGISVLSNNNVLIENGGLMEAASINVGVGSTMTNRGGIYQFATYNPILVSGSPGNLILSNGVISFRDVANADVFAPNNNFVYYFLSAMTFQGDNALRLNNSSNTTSVAQDYTFDTGRGATNFVGLQLVNGNTLWRSANLTIGSGGNLLASNTTGTVAAKLVSSGSVHVVNSTITYTSNVVISGSYVSDPSTNTFAADATITPSGTLAGGTGDLFDFKKSLFIQSTNSQGFKLQSSAVQFSGGGMHTNEITGLDLGGKGFAYDTAFAHGTNFAYGELHLGSATDEICFSCANTQPSNALYVGWLDLLSGTFGTNLVANLHASNNVTIYYAFDDVRNAYLGNQTFQLTQCDGVTLGGFLMPVIPEPTTMAFLMIALAGFGRRLVKIRNKPE